jgi:hypothetical protein
MTTVTTAALDEIRTTAPQAPTTLETTGLTTDMVEQLLVKTLYDHRAHPGAHSQRAPD